MALSWRRDGDAEPAHARESEPQSDFASHLEPAEVGRGAVGPAHFKGGPGAGDGRPPERRWPGWLIPVAACVVALTCIVAIAIPASLLSDSAEADALAEALIPDEPLPAAFDSTLGASAGLAKGAKALVKTGADLTGAVRAIEATGHRVGYDVTTADGQTLLSLNADERFYGASAIKGPFVLRAFPEGVPEEYHRLVEDTIKHSDNESYLLLRDYLGYDVLADQLDELGVEGFSPTMSFLWMTPRQLAELWVRNLPTLRQQGEGGDWLRETFSATDNSAIGTLPADKAWSKGGWFESDGDTDPDEDLGTTVDAGAVVHGDRTYVMAVMTNAPEDFEALAKVVNALDAVLTARTASTS